MSSEWKDGFVAGWKAAMEEVKREEEARKRAQQYAMQDLQGRLSAGQ